MGFTALNATDLETGKRITESLLTNIKNDLDYLYSNVIDVSESGGVIRNGGFEIDADANGQPDNWDITLYTGGGSTLVTTATIWAEPIHGSKTLCFTRPAGVGNGAGYALSDYFPISTSMPIVADMILYADTSAVDNGVGIYLYDKNKTYTTYISPYRSTNESTAARRLVVAARPLAVSGAKFGRLMINCGGTAMGSSAHIYVDDVHADVGLSGRVFYCGATKLSTMTIGNAGLVDKSSTNYPNEMTFELPYTNGSMAVDLAFQLSLFVDITSASTFTGGSSYDVPKTIGIALGNSTFITEYKYTPIASTYLRLVYNYLIPLDGSGKQVFNVYIRMDKDSTLAKAGYPTTCKIDGPFDASYKIITGGY